MGTQPPCEWGPTDLGKGINMAGFDVFDVAKKAFLAGVGAVAIGAEKAQELVDDFIEKGQITVEQGKELNEELTRKVRETAADGQDAVLRAHLKTMTPEQREEWLKRASQVAADIDAEAVEVDVEEEPEIVDEADVAAADPAAEE